MRQLIRWAFYSLVLFLVWSIQVWAEGDRGWEQIDASTFPQLNGFTDRNGVERTPSCSGGPELTAEGIVPADPRFTFFVRNGNPRKLLIALDGGGACWDPNTCIGTALAGDPIYELKVDETEETLNDAGGIGDHNNPDNPFRDFTQVFVPYCTGDIHWGSRDTDYHYTAPDGTPVSWKIHHRGFDNFLAVLEWLADYYQSNIGSAPDQVVIAGGSAGGYGVLLALPAVKEILPRRTRTYVLADSANGVISEDFYNRALGGYAVSGGVWGIEKNIPDFLLGPFASGSDALAVSTYATLAWRNPRTRFGQYTRAWDSVQTFYYNVSKELQFPERWDDPEFLQPTAVEWSLKARANMWLSALAPNYRFYIAAGTGHTLLADEGFYTENSAEDLPFTDWVDDMINKRSSWWWSTGSNWRNVSCFPNCLELE